MIRLAHLSDIHITAATLEWSRADWWSRRSTSWFNHRFLGREKRFRHAAEVLAILMKDLGERRIERIIFSGDATALGFDSEFRRAAEFLDVSQRPGLAVPGNHDYCTPSAAESGLFERHFAPWLEGVRIDGAKYPFAVRAGPAWLIGVNSATGNIWPWDAAGSVGMVQLDRLRKLLTQLEPGPRILVTHFPVSLANGRRERPWHGLRDLAQTAQVACASGIRLWLHGHRHGPYILPRTEVTPFPVICAGSATQTNHWSYFEYDLDAEHIRITRRFFDPKTGRFLDADTTSLPLV